MTCSLQTYRTRIGTFYNSRLKLKPKKNRISKTQQHSTTYFIIFCIIVYSGLIVNVTSPQQLGGGWIASPNIGPGISPASGCPESLHCLVWDPGIKFATSLHLRTGNVYPWVGRLDHIRIRDDPLGALGSTGSSTFSWLNIKERKKSHTWSVGTGGRGARASTAYIGIRDQLSYATSSLTLKQLLRHINLTF
jgi:hypothetical protein